MSSLIAVVSALTSLTSSLTADIIDLQCDQYFYRLHTIQIMSGAGKQWINTAQCHRMRERSESEFVNGEEGMTDIAVTSSAMSSADL